MGDVTRYVIRIGVIAGLVVLGIFLVSGLQRVLAALSQLRINTYSLVGSYQDNHLSTGTRPTEFASVNSRWADDEISPALFLNTWWTQSVLCEIV